MSGTRTRGPFASYSGDELAAALNRLTFREVEQQHWGDLVRLFENPGGPKACWCMVWRATPDETKKRDGASRKAALERRVRVGTPIGILGYLDDEPVAWCSVAPRQTYRPLGGMSEPGDEPSTVWSVVCFFVPRWLRGLGIAARLIRAAVSHARTQGATVVEAYPVEPDSPSYRFMGFVSTFRAAGFRELGTAAPAATCCACGSTGSWHVEPRSPSARRLIGLSSHLLRAIRRPVHTPFT